MAPASIIVSRHGESVASAHNLSNGDPARDGGLTAQGREQAHRLGELISDDPIELCVTSLFPRTHQTGEIAIAGRGVPFIEETALDDLRYGQFEGEPKAAYHDWSVRHGMAARPPGGGESRVDVVRRLSSALEWLLERRERHILVVTHELLVGYLSMAAHGEDPAPKHPDVPYATPYRFSAEEIGRASRQLQDWLARSHEL